MERKQISEECQTFLQLIYERNEENKAKKDAWERKVNHISAKEKAQDQAEIKKHADIAKDEQKCANDCDKIAMQAGTNHRKFALYNDKYQDHMQRAGWSNAEKQDVIDKVRAKYTKTRAVSEECEAFLNMNCMEVSQEAAKKVYDRKANELEQNTQINKAYGDAIRSINKDKGEFHRKHPNATTQDRYNHLSQLQANKNRVNQNAERLQAGAKRLYRWGVKQKDGVDKETAKSAINMANKGKENLRSLAED